MLAMIELARAQCRTLREVWEEANVDMNWFALSQVQETLNTYKADLGKVDFSDMLAQCHVTLDIDAAVIDEAQDLSNAQWNMAKVMFRKAQHIDIAGDDDQAIYGWSGANVERFLGIRGDNRILNKSYRLPQSIAKVASNIVQQIGRRQAKEFAPRADAGRVEYLTNEEQCDLDSGEWLLLARNGYMLKGLEEVCKRQGVAYNLGGKSSVKAEDVRAIVLWTRRQKGVELTHDDLLHVKKYTREKDIAVDWFDALTRIPVTRREYYLSVLRNGERLQDEPRVTISTIHGAKGGEADNVLLMTDMAYRTHNGMQADPDNEHRVFYVGATRAREALHIVQPQTQRHYAGI